MSAGAAPAPVVHAEAVLAVVVNYRTPELTIHCLRSLARERRQWPKLRAVIADGDSGDGSADALAAAIERLGLGDWVTLEPLPINGGFAYANNQAVLRSEATAGPIENILFLNPDAELSEGALAPMVARLHAHPRIAAVGAQLVDEQGGPVLSAFHFPTAAENFVWAAKTGALRRLLRRRRPPRAPAAALRVDAVSGAAMLVRRAAFAEVGLFNDHFFLYFEETELCHRFAAAGWEVWTEPAARVIHAGSKATKLFDSETGALLPRRLPAYWYESWWRFFMFARGRGYALASGVAWTLGHAVWLARCLVTRQRVEQPPHLVGDFWRVGLATMRRRDAPLPRLDDPPGATPAWAAVSQRPTDRPRG